MLDLFHNIILIISGISAGMVILSRNPVDSVLFLILTFLASAAYLFLIEAEFLAFIFIIIYVGAIAVLFLFIVMMLDIKFQEYKTNFFAYMPIVLLFGGLFFVQIFLACQDVFSKFSLSGSFSSWVESIDQLTNTEIIGQLLYTDFILCFLLAGILLLIAMLGAIVLTLNYISSRKNELVSRQISRSGKSIYLV